MPNSRKPASLLQVAIVAIVVWIGVYAVGFLPASSPSTAPALPTVTSGRTSSPDVEATELANRSTAQVCAESQIKKMLKSPSTADFPWFPDSVSKVGDRYLVLSYVDAENSFRANIRQHWQCRIMLGERLEDCVADCSFSGQ